MYLTSHLSCTKSFCTFLIYAWIRAPIYFEAVCSFWEEVRQLVFKLTSVELGNYLKGYLLHFNSDPLTQYKSSLMVNLLNAARACIPALWKQPITPLIYLWLTKIRHGTHYGLLSL